MADDPLSLKKSQVGYKGWPSITASRRLDNLETMTSGRQLSLDQNSQCISFP